MQTLICTRLFYNWGFGLWNQVGPAFSFVLSLAIFFGLQVPFSLWWTRHHERGPVQALWARLTYGRNSGRNSGRNGGRNGGSKSSSDSLKPNPPATPQ